MKRKYQKSKIYQLVITYILIGMIQWINEGNLKWFWWELDRKQKKHDLIRNLNIFPVLSKNRHKTQKGKNFRICQLENTHILMFMIQWHHLANLKRFWVGLDIKLDMNIGLNDFPKTLQEADDAMITTIMLWICFIHLSIWHIMNSLLLQLLLFNRCTDLLNILWCSWGTPPTICKNQVETFSKITH